jgi:hypothetical protein
MNEQLYISTTKQIQLQQKNPQKPIFCNRLQNPPNQNSTIKKSGPGFQARGSSGRTERTLEFVIVGT